MSYEEEDTCHITRKGLEGLEGGGYMSYVQGKDLKDLKEEDTCHMRRRIHVICTRKGLEGLEGQDSSLYTLGSRAPIPKP